MKNSTFTYIMAIAFVQIIVSCGSNDVDVTPPEMEVVAYAPNPQEGMVCGSIEPTVFTLTGGEQLAFDVIFKDNEALSQYKIDIHNNFDCHGHGGGSAPNIVIPNVDNQTTDWTLLDIQDLDGTDQSVQRTLDVPSNVTAGFYHFQIQVVDESGNDNPAANFFALNVFNPLDSTAPSIAIDKPTLRTFQVKKGETIAFKGEVTDNRSLSDGGNGVLFLAYTDLSSGNTFATDVAIPFDRNIDKTYSYDFEYVIPSTLTKGDYRFSLGANDGVRNTAPFQFFEVKVTN